ncbi:MAG: hypothetical protein V7L21_26250 [Nostoc sp.]|nr:hypothetical protein [Nostoc sp. NMS9]MBN3942984.1 hypothetical protein [Nostoc sp. NMS9]
MSALESDRYLFHFTSTPLHLNLNFQPSTFAQRLQELRHYFVLQVAD